MPRLCLCNFVAVLSLLASLTTLRADEPATPAASPTPAQLTAEQDHQRLMDLLGIKSLRRGASGNASDPNAANYDESKATPYPSLPDPLLTQDRRVVSTPEMWWNVRRPEIVELFDREIYGRVPADAPAVKWEVVSTEEGTNGDVPIVTKKLLGHVDNSRCPQLTCNIDLTLVTPAKATAPVPVVMQFSFDFGRFRARAGAGAGAGARPGGAGGPPAGPQGPTWQQQVLTRGWGYATLMTYTIQEDNGAGLTRGVIGIANAGQPRQPDQWGALRAWAWGASRCLDYFETDPAVDAKHVAIEGHSRFGKATLVAMAYEQRFAAAYVSSSGAGGAKLARRNYGELVENLAGTGEYHWMAGNYIKYGGPLTWDDMPVDAHELVALCAPRPVFISVGNVGDQWTDARGMFLAAAGAQPVYRLLGKRDMGTSEMPAVETGLTEGDIAFRQHNAGHTDGPNWPVFLDFAARYFTPSAETPTEKF